jgi:hypothetical protein
VKSEIQGSDRVDTLARQVAVLSYLPHIIERMQMVPGRPYNSATPDEARLTYAYNLASYELSQSYLKSASPENAKAFHDLTGRYDMNTELSKQMYGLLTPATFAEFNRISGAANARAQARSDQQRRENERVRAQEPPPGPGAATAMRSDPGSVAVRRCLELGGGELECISKGLTTGMADLAGLNVNALAAQSNSRGLRIGGSYQTTAGVTLGFSSNTVNLAACGKLETDARNYSVTRQGDHLRVEIQTEPKPLVVVLGQDGRFIGPAAIDITGRVIVGYRKLWVEKRRVSDNTVVPGSGHEESVPIFEPKTERCGFAVLRPTARVVAQGSLVGQIVGLAGGQADPASQRSDTSEAPAGPRMAGKYGAANGLQLEFQPTAAVLDCGEAHVLRPYTVENFADRLVVTVRNGNVPLPLTLRPDGTLSGSGGVNVAGRVVTGTNDQSATFAARNTHCAVGLLAPQ